MCAKGPRGHSERLLCQKNHLLALTLRPGTKKSFCVHTAGLHFPHSPGDEEHLRRETRTLHCGQERQARTQEYPRKGCRVEGGTSSTCRPHGGNLGHQGRRDPEEARVARPEHNQQELAGE